MLTLSKLSRYLYEITTNFYDYGNDTYDIWIEKHIKYRLNRNQIGYNINYTYHNDKCNRSFTYRNVYNIQVSYTLFQDKSLSIYIQKFSNVSYKIDSILEIKCDCNRFTITFHEPKYINLLSCFQV
jgi:hypothetical protein